MVHEIPPEWIEAVGVVAFQPTAQSYRCDVPHTLMALTDIDLPRRNEGVTLDANGFGRARMVRILEGIRDDEALPPIYVEPADPGQRRYRLRAGFHRFYASLSCGFSHIPVDIVERL
jgi:hypothetical protein